MTGLHRAVPQPHGVIALDLMLPDTDRRADRVLVALTQRVALWFLLARGVRTTMAASRRPLHAEPILIATSQLKHLFMRFSWNHPARML